MHGCSSQENGGKGLAWVQARCTEGEHKYRIPSMHGLHHWGHQGATYCLIKDESK